VNTSTELRVEKERLASTFKRADESGNRKESWPTPDYEEARRIILGHVTPLGSERVGLVESLGRMLAEDIAAPWDLPSFSNSAMDGYAVRAADCLEVRTLPIIDYVSAGRHATRSVIPGTAIKIMTGAPLPEGSDSIVPIEDAEESNGTVRVMQPVAPHQHVRFAGEDVRQGETVLASGTLVRPYEINMLARETLNKLSYSASNKAEVGAR
jgi:molybdopterin molybdotransferase